MFDNTSRFCGKPIPEHFNFCFCFLDSSCTMTSSFRGNFERLNGVGNGKENIFFLFYENTSLSFSFSLEISNENIFPFEIELFNENIFPMLLNLLFYENNSFVTKILHLRFYFMKTSLLMLWYLLFHGNSPVVLLILLFHKNISSYAMKLFFDDISPYAIKLFHESISPSAMQLVHEDITPYTTKLFHENISLYAMKLVHEDISPYAIKLFNENIN